MNIQKPFLTLSVCSFKVTRTLANWAIFQHPPPLLYSSWQSIDRGNGIGLGNIVFYLSSLFTCEGKEEEGEKCLRVSGSRPRRVAMGCLSNLSDSAVDGGIICSRSKDQLQQIVANTRDILSPWLMGSAKRQNNPSTSAIWTKSLMGKIPCLLAHTSCSPPLLWRLFFEKDGHGGGFFCLFFWIEFSSWLLLFYIYCSYFRRTVEMYELEPTGPFLFVDKTHSHMNAHKHRHTHTNTYPCISVLIRLLTFIRFFS